MVQSTSGGLAKAAARVGGGVLLAMTGLLHLQFAVQAIAQAPPQGALAFVAAGALALGSYRVFRGQPAAAVVFLGTVPLFLLHIPVTILDRSESPIFLIASAVVPALAGLGWLVRRGIHRGQGSAETEPVQEGPSRAP
jgi:peptidoglycan/LPS O-acetylase OafA/YrhL